MSDNRRTSAFEHWHFFRNVGLILVAMGLVYVVMLGLVVLLGGDL